jgi:PDZ domain-containing protein
VRGLLTPARIAGTLVGLAAATGIVMYLVPSNDYLLLPDRAHPVAPLVYVQGGHEPSGPGGIYFLDVFERRANLLESVFPSIRSGSTLVPAQALIPPGSNVNDLRRADERAMAISQRVAAAVALHRLGYHVVAKPAGVIVADVLGGSHAVGRLQPADVIVAVNGRRTDTVGQLRAALGRHPPGVTVTLRVLRGGRPLTIAVQTVADPLNRKRALVGFTPEQAAQIKLPLKVRIDVGNVGGPSAGLAFALEVMEQLGHDVDHGYRVAATGQLELDGTVDPIGGVRQKIYGARLAHVDVFLVPAGDNAREAKQNAHGVRVIPVHNFPQALRALATLPPKVSKT